MFVFYIIPLTIFALLFKMGKIDRNVLLLLISTLICTWAAEVSVADGFIRDMGSSELIKEYENYAMPGFAIILGLLGITTFIYSAASLFRKKK